MFSGKFAVGSRRTAAFARLSYRPLTLALTNALAKSGEALVLASRPASTHTAGVSEQFTPASTAPQHRTLHDFTVLAPDGNTVSLDKFKSKPVVLVVNTASECVLCDSRDCARKDTASVVCHLHAGAVLRTPISGSYRHFTASTGTKASLFWCAAAKWKRVP